MQSSALSYQWILSPILRTKLTLLGFESRTSRPHATCRDRTSKGIGSWVELIFDSGLWVYSIQCRAYITITEVHSYWCLEIRGFTPWNYVFHHESWSNIRFYGNFYSDNKIKLTQNSLQFGSCESDSDSKEIRTSNFLVHLHGLNVSKLLNVV